MSCSITTDMFCDQCGMWSHWSTGEKPDVRGAKNAATQDGWTFRVVDGLQQSFCPSCNGKEPDYWKYYRRDPAKKYNYHISKD